MSKALARRDDLSVAQTGQMEEIISNIVLKGDISQLKPNEKVQYYNQLCQRIGLDPMTQPFEIVKFQGKEVLYARKGATEQLRALHGISVTAMTSQHLGDCFVVQVTVQNAKGRVDFGTGAVSIAGKKGDELANALMKAETKAKRRATLSICGLGMLDETEIETIPDAKPVIGEMNELRGAPMPAALAGKIDEVLANARPLPVTAAKPSEPRANAPDGPASPAKSPEPASGAGELKNGSFIDWQVIASELGKGKLFDARFKALLAAERVKSMDELSREKQKQIVSQLAEIVKAWQAEKK